MAAKKLTPNEKIFADEWLVDRNGIRAYRKAFKSCKSDAAAGVGANKKLKKANVKAYIEARLEKISKKLEISTERVLQEDARIAYSDIGELFNGPTLIPPADLPENVRRAVSSVKVTERKSGEDSFERVYEYKFWDKGRAIERLDKHLGVFEKDNKQKTDPLVDVLKEIAKRSAPLVSDD